MRRRFRPPRGQSDGMDSETIASWMSDAFTVLWTKEHCQELRKAGEEGRALTVLFGGAHQSCPSLARAGISPGDVVFPLMVKKGELHIIAGAVTGSFISLHTYLTEHLMVPSVHVEGVLDHRLRGSLAPLGITGHRLPYGCGIEVLLVERSTPIAFDIVVSPEQLETIRFCPKKGPSMELRHIADGKLKSSLRLQGNIRRLCPETRNLFAALVGLS